MGYFKKPKYHNKKTGGFDSKKESERYLELLMLQKAGKIRDLKTQVPYLLIPAQYINGKCAERSVKYIADFTYYERRGDEGAWELVVEDTKGMKTPEYIIKRKLMLWQYQIRVREV